MEAFKLAFETVFVGTLALPWLVLMVVLVNPRIAGTIRRHAEIVPEQCVPAVAGVVAFSLAYLLGSAISPVAREFLNDMGGLGLPTEQTIQARIVQHPEETALSSSPAPRAVTLAAWGDAGAPENSRGPMHPPFSRQESVVLLQGAEASERVNRLHERVTVLMGATFSGFTLTALCVFAGCARWRKRLRAQAYPPLQRIAARGAAYLPSLALIAWGGTALVRDWQKHDIDDPPIMELVLLILGFFGLRVTARPKLAIPSVRGMVLFAAFLTVLSYGGYISTEPYYVHEVVNSYAAIASAQPPVPLHSAASAGVNSPGRAGDDIGDPRPSYR